MASGRGPLVLRLSLASSTAYSHSRPIAAKVRPVTSLPLGLRMKLPVTWFFTAGHGERITQISILLHRSMSQASSETSRPSQWAPQAPGLPVTPSHLSPSSQIGHHTVPTQHPCLWTQVHIIPFTFTVFPSSCLTNIHPYLRLNIILPSSRKPSSIVQSSRSTLPKMSIAEHRVLKPLTSSVVRLIWRNYLVFLCCFSSYL